MAKNSVTYFMDGPLMWHFESSVQEGRATFQSTKFLQIAAFYAKSNVLMINEIKSCERLQKLLDDNAKLRAITNERRLTADSF